MCFGTPTPPKPRSHPTTPRLPPPEKGPIDAAEGHEEEGGGGCPGAHPAPNRPAACGQRGVTPPQRPSLPTPPSPLRPQCPGGDGGGGGQDTAPRCAGLRGETEARGRGRLGGGGNRSSVSGAGPTGTRRGGRRGTRCELRCAGLRGGLREPQCGRGAGGGRAAGRTGDGEMRGDAGRGVRVPALGFPANRGAEGWDERGRAVRD